LVGRAAPPPSTSTRWSRPKPATAEQGTANGLQVISVVAGRPAAVAGGALVDVFVIPRELADW